MCSFRPVVPVRFVLVLLCASLFIIQLGLSLSEVPSTMLMQGILCKQHFAGEPEWRSLQGHCLDPSVQRELNMISIGTSISVTIAGALASIPYGLLCGRIGRVPVLGMSLLGLLLSQGFFVYILAQNGRITLKALWGLGVPLLLGGGRAGTEAVVFTIVSDTAATSRRANSFQWVAGAVLLGQLLGLLLAQPLTSLSLWIPIGLSPGLIFLGGLTLVLFTPETLPLSRFKSDADIAVHTPTWRTVRLMFKGPTCFLLPGAMLAIPVATMQSEILLRFMPIHFKWTLPHSGLLLSLRSLLTILVLIVVLPSVSWLITKLTSWTSLCRDQALARASASLFMLGSLGLMMVENESLVIVGFCVSTLGSGIPTLCRAMLVTAIGECDIGVVFGVLAGGEVLGMLACQVGMGWLFDVSLTSWPGLPFALAMLLAVGIGLATWMARVRTIHEPTERSLDNIEV